MTAARPHTPRATRRLNAAPSTGYVCREHLTPVTWQGRGCPDCTYWLSLNRRQRRAARINGDTP